MVGEQTTLVNGQIDRRPLGFIAVATRKNNCPAAFLMLDICVQLSGFNRQNMASTASPLGAT
jgi:hypothetical protein